jgi:hypothetical protein
MKIKISKSRLSLLISGIIYLNLLKNKIFKIKIWCSSDFVLKTLERASDLKMLISFPFFCLSFLMSET